MKKAFKMELDLLSGLGCYCYFYVYDKNNLGGYFAKKLKLHCLSCSQELSSMAILLAH